MVKLPKNSTGWNVLANLSYHYGLIAIRWNMKVVIGGILLLGWKSGMRHFVQNLLGVKVHVSCKISKFCQNPKIAQKAE